MFLKLQHVLALLFMVQNTNVHNCLMWWTLELFLNNSLNILAQLFLLGGTVSSGGVSMLVPLRNSDCFLNWLTCVSYPWHYSPVVVSLAPASTVVFYPDEDRQRAFLCFGKVCLHPLLIQIELFLFVKVCLLYVSILSSCMSEHHICAE